MIEADDAKKVVEVIGNNLIGVSHDSSSFAKLPDSFWGYFARGHDKKGTFGVIVTYSEEGKDVDELIKMYEEWAAKIKQNQKNLLSFFEQFSIPCTLFTNGFSFVGRITISNFQCSWNKFTNTTLYHNILSKIAFNKN